MNSEYLTLANVKLLQRFEEAPLDPAQPIFLWCRSRADERGAKDLPTQALETYFGVGIEQPDLVWNRPGTGIGGCKSQSDFFYRTNTPNTYYYFGILGREEGEPTYHNEVLLRIEPTLYASIVTTYATNPMEALAIIQSAQNFMSEQ